MFSPEHAAHRVEGTPLLLATALVVATGALVPTTTVLETTRTTLPADGRSVVRVEARALSLFGNATPFGRARVVVDDGEARALGVVIFRDHTGAVVARAGTTPGTLAFHDDRGATAVRVRFVPDARDADADGLPDVAELTSHDDRRAFTSWFTAIAEMQARAIDDDWAHVHQDCAGLVRFAAKEALRTHDDAWRAARRSRVVTRAFDVGAFRYPHLPLTGDKLWRQRSGAFEATRPVDAQMTASANARTLLHHNVSAVSRDITNARAGDLLFFHVPDAAGSRMHTMIALAAYAGGPLDDQATRVVYHTGGDGERGEVRLVTLEALASHPDAGWRPRVDNPRFLGVYRLHLLTHDVEHGRITMLDDDHTPARPSIGFAHDPSRAPEAP